MNHALLVAFHYPPARGSSGIQRALSFSRYLADYGWRPLVLSARRAAYPVSGDDQLRDVPPDIVVERAFALDVARHLAIRGRYVGAFAYPDRWNSWWLGGVLSGLRLIRRYKPQALWSTFPIPTAHLIGLTLHRLTGIPWVADFRDSMTEDYYPTDPRKRSIYRWIERKVVATSAYSVFTSPGTARMYECRYPGVPAARWQCISNGYDENAFADLRGRSSIAVEPKAKVVLLHSGLLYPSERDPRVFFAAVKELKGGGALSADAVVIRLRASGHEDLLQSLIDKAGIGDIVKLEPPIGYRAAIAEMVDADGLLLFQASNCNHQTPAKVYEYLRAQRPILALTDPMGDTARLLVECGIDTVAPLDSKEKIKEVLLRFLALAASGHAPVASLEMAQRYSRRSQTGQLARLLDTLV